VSLLSAPFESFFNRNLYWRASQASAAQGFLYLLYFSGLVTVLLMLAISTTVLPAANRFLGWVKINMPVLEMTPGQGMSMNVPSPYTLVHPEYGNVAMFDMNKTEISLEEAKGWRVFITSTKAYFQKENGQLQVYDLKERRSAQGAGAPGKAVLDAAFVQKVENIVKPILLVIAAAAIFIFFFLWKLLAALFYSLIGLGINRLRRERLSYAQILNISFLAITPAAWLQLLLLSRGSQIPYGFLWSLAVTSAYLYFGIKKTEEEFPASA
jgi:hypothetical protein